MGKKIVNAEDLTDAVSVMVCAAAILDDIWTDSCFACVEICNKVHGVQMLLATAAEKYEEIFENAETIEKEENIQTA